jgi:hypothetical protein
MTEKEYIVELNKALLVQRNIVLANLNTVLLNIPELTKKISLDIFLPQDVDGSFSVYVGLIGPDLFVLNKKIEKIAEIFSVTRTNEGFVPYLPLVEDEEYDTYKIICSCTLDWLKSIWTETNCQHIKIPVELNIADDYGEFPTVKLN